jgi:hypothetical protein
MGDYETNKMQPVTIGYYDDNALYLLPNETWHELSRYCIQEGSYFPYSKTTFFKLLKERGLIEPAKDGQPTTQKKLHGKNQRVLKLIGGSICEYFVTSVTDNITN